VVVTLLAEEEVAVAPPTPDAVLIVPPPPPPAQPGATATSVPAVKSRKVPRRWSRFFIATPGEARCTKSTPRPEANMLPG
jgi:hypothetical protein